MKLSEQLKALDDLIVQNTQGSVTTKLRNPLHSMIEQAEAYEVTLAQNNDKIKKLESTLQEWEKVSKLQRPSFVPPQARNII
jgi:predicted DNA-binding protein YlxM (UPF0122 family)